MSAWPCATAGEHEDVAVDERGGGVVPLDLHAGVFLHHVVVPDLACRWRRRSRTRQHGVDDVDLAAVDDGRAAGAITAFVVRRAGIATAVVFGDDAEGLAPEFLAGLFIEAGEHFAGVAVGFAGDEGVGLAACDGEGAETEVRG
jgi:hypothetical protein